MEVGLILLVEKSWERVKYLKKKHNYDSNGITCQMMPGLAPAVLNQPTRLPLKFLCTGRGSRRPWCIGVPWVARVSVVGVPGGG